MKHRMVTPAAIKRLKRGVVLALVAGLVYRKLQCFLGTNRHIKGTCISTI